jgi:hypothetical protein
MAQMQEAGGGGGGGMPGMMGKSSGPFIVHALAILE